MEQINYTSSIFPISGQKKIKRLLEKDIYKVVTSDTAVMHEEILSVIKSLIAFSLDEIKALCSDKAYESSYPVINPYNNEKKNYAKAFTRYSIVQSRVTRHHVGIHYNQF